MKQIWALLYGGSETQEISSNWERGDEEIESEKRPSEKRGTGRTGQEEVKLTDQRARLPTGWTNETPNSWIPIRFGHIMTNEKLRQKHLKLL